MFSAEMKQYYKDTSFIELNSLTFFALGRNFEKIKCSGKFRIFSLHEPGARRSGVIENNQSQRLIYDLGGNFRLIFTSLVS